MTDYRTLDEVTIEYLTEHSDEIDDCLSEVIADYEQDGVSAALLSTLRVIARVNSISNIASKVNMIQRKENS